MSLTGSTGTEEEVARRRREWVEAVNARDLGRYADVVTEDLVWLPPMGEAIEGRGAFREWLAPFFEGWRYDFGVEVVEVRAFEGGWCAERGRFLSRMTPAGGGEAREHGGEYFVLWRLEDDGRWRMDRYVDVTSGDAGG